MRSGCSFATGDSRQRRGARMLIMELDELLAYIDRADANLGKLDAVWQ